MSVQAKRQVQTRRTLLRDAAGSIAIWAVFALPAVVSVGALAVDLGRFYALENDLQSAADAYARAAAFELDGRADAITRANRAIATLVSNDERFGDNGSRSVAVASVRFLKSLPADDFEALTPSHDTTSASLAEFVEVKVTPSRITSILPVSMVTGRKAADLSASAIGGAARGVCNAAPLFICNPYEGQAPDLYAAMNSQAERRKLIEMKASGGPNAQYGPGVYGYLRVGGSGANVLKDALAKTKPDTCYSLNGVEVEPGNVSSAHQGFNTRFDIYDGNYKQSKSDPAFAPAPNVTKGFTGKGCNGSAGAGAMGLPRDFCFDTGTCPGLGGRQGDGNWDLVGYLEVNHGSPFSITIEDTAYTINYATRLVTPQLPTRYQIYQWEIATGRIPGTPAYVASTTPENGAPQCYSGPPAGNGERRILTVAVLDCIALSQLYSINGASTPPLPVTAFWKVFATEPMGSGNDSEIWGELVGPVEMGRDAGAAEIARVMR